MIHAAKCFCPGWNFLHQVLAAKGALRSLAADSQVEPFGHFFIRLHTCCAGDDLALRWSSDYHSMYMYCLRNTGWVRIPEARPIPRLQCFLQGAALRCSVSRQCENGSPLSLDMGRRGLPAPNRRCLPCLFRSALHGTRVIDVVASKAVHIITPQAHITYAEHRERMRVCIPV